MLLIKVRADDHIVLPKALVEKLGVSAGEYLEMEEQGGEIVIRSARQKKDQDDDLSQFCGKWQDGREAEEIVSQIDTGCAERARSEERDMRLFWESFGSWEDERTAEEIIKDIRAARKPVKREIQL